MPSLGATRYTVGPDRLDSQAQGENAPFNQTILRFPGVAQDSFGQLHVRGEHANLQYRIDDVLLPESIPGFGQELETRFADSVSLITGALRPSSENTTRKSPAFLKSTWVVKKKLALQCASRRKRPWRRADPPAASRRRNSLWR